jgi:ribonuclease HI
MTKLRIYSDGGARGNPGPAAIGVVICDERGAVIQEHKETIGDATNNIAEYTGVLVGLELAKQLGAKEIDYFVDSELVANQINGKYKIKTPHIKILFDKVKERFPFFSKITFTHVPREHEKLRHADKLVNLALDGY